MNEGVNLFGNHLEFDPQCDRESEIPTGFPPWVSTMGTQTVKIPPMFQISSRKDRIFEPENAVLDFPPTKYMEMRKKCRFFVVATLPLFFGPFSQGIVPRIVWAFGKEEGLAGDSPGINS